MPENAVIRGMITSALLRGALAEARWQQKDREEGFGTFTIEGTTTDRIYMDKPNVEELDNSNNHTAQPKTD
jgi:hypothetical protein